MKVAAEQCKINVAKVEIKCVSIDNKQMTLAVFRQLPFVDFEDASVDEDKTRFWGRVNYHTDQCNPKKAGYDYDDTRNPSRWDYHSHVVFVDEGELKHTIIPEFYALRNAEEQEYYNQLGIWVESLPQLFIAV